MEDVADGRHLAGANDSAAVFGEMLSRVAQARVVPVVSLASADDAVPLADALIAGGISAVEITLRTAAGLAGIERLANYSPALTVGAGTVVTPEQAHAVIDAGAEFVISPGIDESVVHACQERGILTIPGVATASEVQLAARLGLTAVKAFPAAQLGGTSFVRAMRGPFPGMRFLPSGGVSLDNLTEYLETPGVLAVSGSWMVQSDTLSAGHWDDVAALSAEAMARAGAVSR